MVYKSNQHDYKTDPEVEMNDILLSSPDSVRVLKLDDGAEKVAMLERTEEDVEGCPPAYPPLSLTATNDAMDIVRNYSPASSFLSFSAPCSPSPPSSSTTSPYLTPSALSPAIPSSPPPSSSPFPDATQQNASSLLPSSPLLPSSSLSSSPSSPSIQALALSPPPHRSTNDEKGDTKEKEGERGEKGESGGTKRSAKSSLGILKRSRGETGEKKKKKENSRVGFLDSSEMEMAELEEIEEEGEIENKMETDGNGSECKNTGGMGDANTTHSERLADEAGPSSSTAKTKEGEKEEERKGDAAEAPRESEMEKGTTQTTTPSKRDSIKENKGKPGQHAELELQEIKVVEMYPDIAPYERDETEPATVVGESVKVGTAVEAQGEFGVVAQPKPDRMVRKEIVRIGIVAIIVLIVVLLFIFL